MRINKILTLALAGILSFSFCVYTYAADYKGYAAFRDGVDLAWYTGGWHAGVSIDSNGDNFYQARGSGQTTGKDDFKGFMNYPKANNNFQGYYYMSGMSTSDRDEIVSTGKKLAEYKLPYSLTSPLGADNANDSDFYSPDEVTSARCDGFLEYCYEWNSVKITEYSWGDDKPWDISEVERGLIAHSFIYIPGLFGSYTLEFSPTLLTPKNQSAFMTYAGGKGRKP